MTYERGEFWLKATKTLGFPVVCAIVLLWKGSGFMDRLLNQHESFTKSVSECNAKQAETLEKVATAQSSQAATGQHMLDLQQAMADDQRELSRTVTKVLDRLDEKQPVMKARSDKE